MTRSIQMKILANHGSSYFVVDCSLVTLDEPHLCVVGRKTKQKCEYWSLKLGWQGGRVVGHLIAKRSLKGAISSAAEA